jgi:hypothetical protein
MCFQTEPCRKPRTSRRCTGCAKNRPNLVLASWARPYAYEGGAAIPHHGHEPLFSLGFGLQIGFSLVHTMLAVVTGRFWMFQGRRLITMVMTPHCRSPPLIGIFSMHLHIQRSWAR